MEPEMRPGQEQEKGKILPREVILRTDQGQFKLPNVEIIPGEDSVEVISHTDPRYSGQWDIESKKDKAYYLKRGNESLSVFLD